MSELSNDARALLEAARGGDDPTEHDRRRVHAAVLASVAVGAAASTLGAATTATAASATGTTATGGLTLGLGAKWVATAVLVGAMGTAAVVLRPTASPNGASHRASATHLGSDAPARAPRAALEAPSIALTPREQHAEALVAPSPTRPVREAPTGEATAAATPRTASEGGGAPAPRSRRALSSAPSSPTSDALAEEAALLRAAHEALARGDAALARARVGEHHDRFPNGTLALERRFVELIARCASDGDADARVDATRLLRGPARVHVLAERLRRACSLGE